MGKVFFHVFKDDFGRDQFFAAFAEHVGFWIISGVAMYWTMIGTPLHLRIPPAVGHASLASGQLRVILDLARTRDLSTWVKKVESASVFLCHFYHGLQIAKLRGVQGSISKQLKGNYQI